MYKFPSEEDWLAWKYKRRNTLIGLILVGAVVGIDASVIFNTLYAYLKDVVQTEHPTTWYGVIIATFYTSASVSAVVCGRWVDKTRRVRVYINFALLFQAIGFLIYAVPYSPINLLVGRFLCGIGDPFMSVVTGEVLRIYDGEESSGAMVWLATTYSFGFIIGPSLGMIFSHANFQLGWIRVNRMNFVSIFMTFCLIVVAIAANVLVSNCSAEFDLKEFLTHQQMIINTKDDINQGEEEEGEGKIDYQEESYLMLDNSLCEDKSISIQRVLYTLAGNVDAALMFFSSFGLIYALLFAFIVFPLIVLNELKWGVNGLSITNSLYGVGALVVYIILSSRCRTNTSVYYTSIASIIGQLLLFVNLLILRVVERNFWADVVLVTFVIITMVASWIFEDILVRVILAKMVPSQIQSFTEGLRAGLVRFGRIAASLSSPFLYSHLPWTCSVFIIIIFGILLWFLVRRKHLIDPKQLKFDEKY